MKITINAVHFDATEKLEQFINKKLDKIARRHEEISEAIVSLKVVKPETALNKEAGIKLLGAKGGDAFASKVANTFEEAVDVAIDALQRQLEKNNDK
ncbi:MAG: HPF/RaiA family ribosome-associated protein [Muribaculaceae bacterium]|nr:HPF/RaiA family ribosome-associated protein [Muribaculaceae bacterium]